MPVQYSIDPERSLVGVSVTDPLDLAQIEEAVERMLSDSRLRPGLNLLSDHSKLDVSATTDLVRAIPAFLERLGERLGRFRCAVVVPRDASFGMARMAEVVTESSRTEVRAFRALEEAEAWLAGPPAD